MGDLTELYSNLLSQAADPMRGYRAMQEQEVRNMELQDKRRQFEAEQQLRELFQRNASPNVSEIGAISPQFAQQYSKSQFDMMKQQADMQNIASQMEERQRRQLYEESKIRAHTFAPIAEQYKSDVATMGEQQARAKFNVEIGRTIAGLEKSGIKMPKNFDPEEATPDAILNAAIGFDYKSPYMEQQAAIAKETGMRELPETYMTPQGPMIKPGIPKQGAPALQPAEIPQGARSEALTDADIQMMQQQFQALPNGSPEKVRIGAMLADAVKQRLPSGQFITPEQRQERERKAKVEETTAIEEAKSAAGKKETAETKVSTLETLPPIESINDLIDKSMSSGLEARVKGITSGEFGRQDESFTATAELQPIQAQIKGLAKSLVGAGAISDYEQKMMEGAAGAIADPRTPTEARKAALRVVYDINQKAIAKYPDLLQRLERSKTASGPTIGTVQDGYKFKGGDPAQANNWEKVQ
jgi:hypothetical protein